MINYLVAMATFGVRYASGGMLSAYKECLPCERSRSPRLSRKR